MKKATFTILGALILLACNNKKNAISVATFEQGIADQNAQLIDVRTAGEFENGHIANAINMDINSADFETKIDQLDKEKPVYVYCLSGGRSSSASAVLNKKGFKNVYDLDGGFLKWERERKPIATNAPVVETPADGNSFESTFNKKIASDSLTMVDFFAEWCGPCKKMEPAIAKIKEDTKAINVVKVDVDREQALSMKYQIEMMPTLIFFKNNQILERVIGYKTEMELRKLIAKYK